MTDSIVPMNILCFSSTDWNGKWGSRQQVMQRLAVRGHQVLFVEQMAGLEHFWKYADLRARRFHQWQEGLRQVEPNLWLISPPPLFPGRYYATGIAWLNAKIVHHWLKPYLQQLNFTTPLLWFYKPEHAPFIGKFNEQLAIYHCIDEFTVGTSGKKRENIIQLEETLLKKVDLVFANSTLTFQNKKVFNPNTYHIPSGADVTHFAQADNPAIAIHPAVKTLPHPVLVFIGNIDERIDISLLAALAQVRPQWSLVLVGQEHPTAVNLQPLQAFANVHRLGKQPFSVLPNILKGADGCLLPYVQNDAALYRSPLKLYEYLATGKPIISTPHPEVSQFKAVVTISTAPNFVRAIESALQNDTPQQHQQRRQLAHRHSWDMRVDEMLTILNVLKRYI